MKKGGRLKLRNVVEGIQGAALIVFAFVTPFLRPWRTRWGATESSEQSRPGKYRLEDIEDGG